VERLPTLLSDDDNIWRRGFNNPVEIGTSDNKPLLRKTCGAFHEEIVVSIAVTSGENVVVVPDPLMFHERALAIWNVIERYIFSNLGKIAHVVFRLTDNSNVRAQKNTESSLNKSASAKTMQVKVEKEDSWLPAKDP
jgi:hypothetical protein